MLSVPWKAVPFTDCVLVICVYSPFTWLPFSHPSVTVPMITALGPVCFHMDESGKGVFRSIEVVESLDHRGVAGGALKDLPGIAAVADSASDNARHPWSGGYPFGERVLFGGGDGRGSCGRPGYREGCHGYER